MSTDILLPATLALAVPLRIADLRAQGGPTPDDWAAARAFAEDLVARADILLYRGGTRDETAALFARLADALAVLSFAQGGITLAGCHWEATP